jgi:hopanoid C-3 methylase
LMQGQTNFITRAWKFNKVYDAARLLEDHHRPVRYEIPERIMRSQARAQDLYVHASGAHARATPGPAAHP